MTEKKKDLYERHVNKKKHTHTKPFDCIFLTQKKKGKRTKKKFFQRENQMETSSV